MLFEEGTRRGGLLLFAPWIKRRRVGFAEIAKVHAEGWILPGLDLDQYWHSNVHPH
jgi:hypothetical protein